MKMHSIRYNITAIALTGLLVSAAPGVNATEKQIADLEADITELKAELEEVSASGGVATQLLSNIETAKEEIETAKTTLPEKEKALAAKMYLLGVYQSAFRVVTSMVAGEDLGTIQLTNGEVITGASFLKTEKGGIQVQTGTGARSIPISQLPAALSGKLQLPPAIASPTTTFEAVKAAKPEVLRTKEDIAAASSATPAGSATTTAAGATAATGAAAPAPQLSQADAYQQIQQRNAARQKQILQIKARYAELFAEKKKARADKASAEAGFRSAKIKKAKSEVDATMDFHNSRITRIEEEEASLRTEMARIQSEFE
jgi:vacuolar-type H+-ATPase subunit I/STV1